MKDAGIATLFPDAFQLHHCFAQAIFPVQRWQASLKRTKFPLPSIFETSPISLPQPIYLTLLYDECGFPIADPEKVKENWRDIESPWWALTGSNR
jgi:hypothetical protein